MTYFFGCKPGRNFGGSAGITRGEVRLDLTALPTTPELLVGVAMKTAGGTAILSLAEQTQNDIWVIYHQDSAGMWHGIGRKKAVPKGCGGSGVVIDPNNNHGQPRSSLGICSKCGAVASQFGDHPSLTEKVSGPVTGELSPEELVWKADSSSGGGQIVAAVVKLTPDAPEFNILLSGYAGRNKRVVTLGRGGLVQEVTRDQWFANHRPAVAL